AQTGPAHPPDTAPTPPAPEETDNGYQAPPGYSASAGALAGAPEPPAALLDPAPVAQDVQQEQQDAQLFQQQPVQQQPGEQEPQPVQPDVAAKQAQPAAPGGPAGRAPPAAPAESAASAAEYFSATPGLAMVQPEQGQGQPSPSS